MCGRSVCAGRGETSIHPSIHPSIPCPKRRGEGEKYLVRNREVEESGGGTMDVGLVLLIGWIQGGGTVSYSMGWKSVRVCLERMKMKLVLGRRRSKKKRVGGGKGGGERRERKGG